MKQSDEQQRLRIELALGAVQVQNIRNELTSRGVIKLLNEIDELEQRCQLFDQALPVKFVQLKRALQETQRAITDGQPTEESWQSVRNLAVELNEKWKL